MIQESEAEERRAEAEEERKRDAEAMRARLERAAHAEKEAKRSLEEHQVEVETLRRKAKLLEASQGCHITLLKVATSSLICRAWAGVVSFKLYDCRFLFFVAS